MHDTEIIGGLGPPYKTQGPRVQESIFTKFERHVRVKPFGYCRLNIIANARPGGFNIHTPGSFYIVTRGKPTTEKAVQRLFMRHIRAVCDAISIDWGISREVCPIAKKRIYFWQDEFFHFYPKVWDTSPLMPHDNVGAKNDNAVFLSEFLVVQWPMTCEEWTHAFPPVAQKYSRFTYDMKEWRSPKGFLCDKPAGSARMVIGASE